MNKLIKLKKISLDPIFEYAKFLLPIYTEQQFSLNPPLQYENPYEIPEPSEIKINPLTTKYFYIPQIQKEIFLIGVMHNNQSSAIEVYDLIKGYQPDSIMTELCENRYRLLQKIYDKQNPEKLMNIMERNKYSIRLLFKKRLEFMFTFELAKRMKNKKCEVILGDFDYYEYNNFFKNAISQCRDPGGFSKLFRQIFRAVDLSFYVLSIYLRRLMFMRVPITKNLFRKMETVFVSKEECKIKTCMYNRDFHLFRSLTSKTTGNKIVGVVGMLHLKDISKLIERYIEGNEKYYQQLNDELKIFSLEDVEKRCEMVDEIEKNILEYCNFRKSDIVCPCQLKISPK